MVDRVSVVIEMLPVTTNSCCSVYIGMVCGMGTPPPLPYLEKAHCLRHTLTYVSSVLLHCLRQRRQGGREAGRQGGREGEEKEGGRDGGTEAEREEGRQRWREGQRERGREAGILGGTEGGREGGREAQTEGKDREGGRQEVDQGREETREPGLIMYMEHESTDWSCSSYCLQVP